MIEINTTKTKYYNWPLVAAFLEAWVQRQSTNDREGIFAVKCWSYAKAVIRQEVENQTRAGLSEDKATARVWEMFEAACRGQPLVEMGQIMLNVTWIGQACSMAEWHVFFIELGQTFRAVHRTTEVFSLPAEYRQGEIRFVDNKKMLQWKREHYRPSDIPIIHNRESEVDPFSSKELLDMLLSLPQAEFDALLLPASIRNVSRSSSRVRMPSAKPDYDPEGLVMDSKTPKQKVVRRSRTSQSKKEEAPDVPFILPGPVSEDDFH